MVTLSVLDQSPIRKGGTAAEALANTIDLARHAERLGYSRYWLAEHHNTASFAGSAPEVMIAAVAGATSHIHVGSAGVMLPHYSPLKVAELFRLLETLYPGRIDLGLGRAPGSDQRTARALQPGPQAYPIDVFPQQVELLIQFLEDSIGLGGEAGGFPIGHPYTGIHATPRGPGLPELWMLGSGGDGAAYAAQFGMAYCFAHFINQDAGTQPLEIYRRNFKPSRQLERPHGSIAVSVTVAETEEEARRISASRNLWVLQLLQNRAGAFPTIEEALAHDYSDEEKVMLRAVERRGIVGTPEQVRGRLLQMGTEHGVDDFVILTITYDQADRVKSYELLAKAFGLGA
ncbi:MAG: LLM class flavin-dependent oxidoreductase [Parvibaculum sp.]|uniref:LLM class flavin-dependent oxidoreductase n=1 Tax=Parvibaculum sp. TaxID=2024848 RepID=UPI0025E82AB6|nr:LLM class flavin-dependent oxidoreductase [Parvibaculum sp.]MCE9650429.1 LLM class flavin-dependent oxidoreductase [Parvibaculum sp.]